MPTYEYACRKCGEQFEYFQSIKDAPMTVCEKCGGELEKLLSAGSGLIFKGSGFYITDYKNKGAAASSPSGGSAGKESSSETKASDPPGTTNKPVKAAESSSATSKSGSDK